MLNIRLEALKEYEAIPMPNWPGQPDLSKLDLDAISYYVTPDAKPSNTWDDVPSEIKDTFEKLGIPESERKSLGGVGAQFDSEVVYHNLKERFSKQGVIFEDLDVAVQKYPDLVKKYFSQCINIRDHKFISLHYAVWSGGTFIYVPPGVTIDIPLQAYFRMNTKSMGQFEHTLIIVDKGAHLHYIEGCSAPRYEKSSLHAGGVEIFVAEDATCRYSSVENWSKNTFNLNTKRAIVEKNGKIAWVGGNLGSGATMLYPCSILKGEGARAEHISIAYAGEGQDQDTGAKIYHLAPHTTSTVTAKSISNEGGRTNYRGHVYIKPGATDCAASVECDALMFDDKSSTDTMPYMEINEEAEIVHEARVGRISEENIFYLQSRGLSEQEAVEMIVNGFMEDITKELPVEYAVELNKLIALEIEGGLG
jgi:Fe-S cluster assembly protein SufB